MPSAAAADNATAAAAADTSAATYVAAADDATADTYANDDATAVAANDDATAVAADDDAIAVTDVAVAILNDIFKKFQMTIIRLRQAFNVFDSSKNCEGCHEHDAFHYCVRLTR